MKDLSVNYKDYMLEKTSRQPENIEWSISYSYNAQDNVSKRVLLIGDSICNGYQPYVRENLSACVNVTFWVSSKCVTDSRFLRELNFYLDAHNYDLILFNNGAHSTMEFSVEREEAYRNTVDFILKKCNNIPLALVLCTPVKSISMDNMLKDINEHTVKLADEKNLPIVDLHTPMLAFDKDKVMGDGVHWNEDVKKVQGKIIAGFIIQTLKPESYNINQLASEKDPDGEIG